MSLRRTALVRLPSFRGLTLAVLAHSVAVVGEQVVLGWLVLELTDSPLMVGAALGVRMAPLLLAGIPAGVVADRADRLRLIRLSGLVMAGAAAALGILTLLGLVRLWALLLLTLLAGAVRALHQAARQGQAHDIAGAGRLVEALATLGFAMRVGGLAGSIGAGVLIARLGPGAAYLAVAAAHLVSVTFVWPARTPGSAPPAAGSGSAWENLTGFLALVRQDRVLPLLMGLTAAGEVLGFSHQTVLPSLARDILAVGPEGLGLMMAAKQVGGIAGIVLVSRLVHARGNGGAFLAALGGFGAALFLLGLAGSFPAVLVVLVVANGMGAACDVLGQTLIQLAVPGARQGRAAGAWVVAIGTAPLGQLQIGAVASWLGVGAALGTSGLALALAALAGAVGFPRLRRL
jgi:hypothetical protein